MSLSVVLLLLLGARPGVPPALAGELVQHLGEHGVRAGEWVTYHASSPSGLNVFLRLAAVAEDPSGTGLWMEIDAGLAPAMEAPLLRLTLLCERRGPVLTGRIRRALAAVAHEAPSELAPSLLPGTEQAATPGSSLLPEGFSVGPGASESLTTRVGTLVARPWEVRYRGELVKRIWMSPVVPILNLARLDLPVLGQTLDVYDFGVGALAHLPLPPSPTPFPK